MAFMASSLQKMHFVIEPEIRTNRQRSNDPHQLVDDAFTDLLIDLLRDSVDGLVSSSTGYFLDLVMRQKN